MKLIKSVITLKGLFPTSLKCSIPEDYLKKKESFVQRDLKSPLEGRNVRSRKQLNTLNNLNLTF